jgi:uncharacterized protein
MRIAALTGLAAVLATPLLIATPADAFNCRIPAFISQSKSTVCKSPALRRLDAQEEAGFAALRSRLSGAGASAVRTDRSSFIATRNGCAADTRCLQATYRAQLRLYRQLARCKPADGACVSRTVQAHRLALHRST